MIHSEPVKTIGLLKNQHSDKRTIPISRLKTTQFKDRLAHTKLSLGVVRPPKMENYKYKQTPILHSIDVSFAWEISLGSIRSEKEGKATTFSSTVISGQKKEPKPKLFGSDIFQWGGGLPREGVGAKKSNMSFET